MKGITMVHFNVRPLGLVLMATLAAFCASSSPNPVILRAADCGLMRFNGRYYLMGTGTSGRMYVSDDLLHWQPPVHVFSMRNAWTPGAAGEDREIHACDLSYHGGLFQLYWSVNFLRNGQDIRAIGHAVADGPTGPYSEPVSDTPFDGRIDPHLFVDQDGSAYFYTVKFGGGNAIWGQSMASPAALVGTPKLLLTALKDTWEWQDHRVNEAPFVIGYRDRYYMLYNANHTWERYGHYAIGAAEADSPLGFDNAAKYPDPVLTDNRERVLSRARTIVSPSLDAGEVWRFVTAPPEEGWNRLDYDDSEWGEGPGAFGNPEHFMPRGAIRTSWAGKGIWLRKQFLLDKTPSEHLQVLVNHDDAVAVFLNGVKAFEHDGVSGGYGAFDVPPEARAALKAGENVLAARCLQVDGPQYVDVGLVDPIDAPGETIITNCGQPSLVRGPNGFEWWCVYFAKYNGGPRCQAVDRVHFLDKRLVIDGPTGPRTPGYHPPPALPTFRDLFEEPRGRLAGPWRTTGEWTVSEGELKVAANETRDHAVLGIAPGTNYLFEASVRFPARTDHGAAGIVAHRDEAGNALTFGFLPSEGAWVAEQIVAGEPVKTLRGALSTLARPEAYRQVRLLRNAGRFSVFVDGVVPKGFEPIETDWVAPGVVGLYAEDGSAAFSGVTYTLGWDEWDAGIRGWDAADGSNKWLVGESGLTAPAKNGQELRAFKGDLLDQYEFAAQVTAGPGVKESGSLSYGCFPVYVDDDNYLRVRVSPGTSALTIETRRDGETVEEHTTGQVEDPQNLNIRAVKLADRVIVWVDGREARTVAGSWQRSRVGLFSRGASCTFNGLSLFHRPMDQP